MSDAVVNAIALIVVGILSFLGVYISNKRSNAEMFNKYETARAVTDCKIEMLTQEVQKHNNFALKIPAIEGRVTHLEQRVDRIETKGG